MQVAESKPDKQVSPLGRRCTVCSHESVTAINSLLCTGQLSERSISKQFGLNDTAVHRHAAEHLPAALAKAVERVAGKDADEWLTGLQRTAKRCDRAVSHAMAAIEEGLVDPELAFRMGPAYAAQASRAREIIGQATGRLNATGPAGGINVNLQIVIPRAVGPVELPAIECEALPAGEPDPPKE